MKDRIRSYVSNWERRGYESGIPDEAPVRLESLNRVASYRLICQAIVKNDFQLETLGFSRTPCELYMHLKRIELTAKGKIKPQRLHSQIELF